LILFVTFYNKRYCAKKFKLSFWWNSYDRYYIHTKYIYLSIIIYNGKIVIQLRSPFFEHVIPILPFHFNFALPLLWSPFFRHLLISFFSFTCWLSTIECIYLFFSVLSAHSLCNQWEKSKECPSSPFRFMIRNTPPHTLYSHSHPWYS